MKDELICVELAPGEVMAASICGVMRHIKAKQQGRERAPGEPLVSWDRDIEGSLGECAVAKAIGVYWRASIAPDYDGDVGPYQVRRIEDPGHSLVVKVKDRSDAVFILVCGARGTYAVGGWMKAGEAKQDRYWRENVPTPNYFVPQADLHPMTTLPRAS